MEQAGVTFGPLVRELRLACGISQNQLARRAGCDSAYINRIERDLDGRITHPSRHVVLRIWEALGADADARERLLVASGHVPEVILAAGGWDAYVRLVRVGMTTALRSMGLDPTEGDGEHLSR